MKNTKKGSKKGMFILLCILAFIVSFVGSVAFKMTYTSPEMRKYSVKWSDEIGTLYSDVSYGDKESNKFDMYVPRGTDKKSRSTRKNPGTERTGRSEAGDLLYTEENKKEICRSF